MGITVPGTVPLGTVADNVALAARTSAPVTTIPGVDVEPAATVTPTVVMGGVVEFPPPSAMVHWVPTQSAPGIGMGSGHVGDTPGVGAAIGALDGSPVGGPDG